MAKNQGNPYENLANAIIVKACDDYRAALKKVKRNPNNREVVQEAFVIEKFFKSGWYRALTSVDGEYLIERIRKEVRQSE